MTAYGLKAMMDKGVRYASDDVSIKLRRRKGKHRHRRAREHKRTYNRIARAMAKEEIIHNSTEPGLSHI